MIRFKVVVKYSGHILLFNSLFLLIAAAISFFNQESSFQALIISFAICAAMGTLPQLLIGRTGEIRFHEGLAISVFGWVITCLAGMIPYLMWGGEFDLANAIFESVSGYTTTGASILTNVEALPMGLLFWRSSTSFIGGVGIILFVLLILPEKGSSLSSFYRAEVSDLSKMSFTMRSRHITRIIVMVYFILIVSQIILLKVAGMSFFDAICHSFTTVATSGFSTRNASIAAYDSVWIESITIFFMLISSMHFGLIYGTMTRKKYNLFRSHPTRMYVLVLFIGIVLIALQLTKENFYSFWEAFRLAAFQVVSLASTTGYATVDTANWPFFSIFLLLYFSIQCGMVGSTAGGIKFDRIYLFFASAQKQLKQILHPEGVYVARMDKQVINQKLELQVMVFIVVYVLTLSLTALLLTTMNIDGMTAFSASVATLGNVGPGFETVGSFGNFGHLPDAAKYILSANMLLGRLEIMNVFALLMMLVFRRKR
ncbi:MAG: TrkH family potassium uptake protein [Proteiniphilum sp.]|jgi:trk system potassium uptake protein TrkH|nr:TrkH family potassium uptake protein [Proteiniphilum sp.]NCB25320.1 TrkH family potassium uptake protein [Bacteroidia bacterium]MDD2937764.1 TrkH family potassium uptake protein [Proteiniphilum sp.]MDD3075629.1 TrkH family potassium uptake protein [Proteiniphilum sp.]MDD3778807.1 TrkH family potassium uptake protein [Proteiniphilum sp.]